MRIQNFPLAKKYILASEFLLPDLSQPPRISYLPVASGGADVLDSSDSDDYLLFIPYNRLFASFYLSTLLLFLRPYLDLIALLLSTVP